jgi:hypothetical protein
VGIVDAGREVEEERLLVAVVVVVVVAILHVVSALKTMNITMML